jgi:hypothetical protein
LDLSKDLFLDFTVGGLLRPRSRLQEMGVAKRPREGAATGFCNNRVEGSVEEGLRKRPFVYV